MLKQLTMSSLGNETYGVEEQPDVEDNRRAERARWVLNTPEPPSSWHELKQTVFPRAQKLRSSFSQKRGGYICLLSVMKSIFPILQWGRNYTATKFKNDLMAGLTLASLSIPQSIGYASLAKLDPQYGLYTSVVPPLVYSLMGSSREIAIGPVAIVSMLLSSLVQKVVDPVADPTAYRKFVITATLFAGFFQTAFGLFRLGFLVDFLSHAAIVGFMAGAAIVIGLQQLKGLLGIDHFTNKTDVISVLVAVFRSIRHPWSPLNFVLGCSFLIFILAMRFVGRKNRKLFWVPALAPLISVVLSTLIVFVTRADKHGVKIIKHLEGGINPSSVKEIELNGPHVGEAAKIGLISAIIALTEAIAVGRSFASVRGYQLDGNKEMVAMGVMNIAGSLTSCYVATGSFSRTAVNFSAGCQTVVSNIVMAIAVLVALQILTTLLYFTPIAILASIILSALPGLIDFNEAYNIWKVDKLDFLSCIGAFFGVLFGSVEIGLLVAVTISFAKIILNGIRPSMEILGQLPTTDIFCSTNQYPMAVKISGTLIIRIHSSYLCFANANFIRERIMRWVKEDGGEEGEKEANENTKMRIQVLIFDMSNLMNIDTSGILALEVLQKELVSHGIELAIANPCWHVIHKLKLAKFVDKIGGRSLFLTIGEAVDTCLGSNMINLKF
uniref:STAS domain-containing protein n=1 Tax=Nelumbo nucifera TaxID=4432 RepID=A0A822ZA33_NELNU|nr:TPA_asm: hypothetical protein HUJ06_014592 [Nelumbo nucifera]